MVAKHTHFMPLYIGDFMADTRHLSTGEVGAYMLLLLAYWRNDGPLPDDDDALAQMACCTPRQWKLVHKKIKQFFYVHDGFLINKRSEIELARARHIVEVRRKAGKRGGDASVLVKQTLRDASIGAQANGQANVEQEGKQTATPSPSLSNQDTNTEGVIEFVGSPVANRPPVKQWPGKRWPPDAVVPGDWIVDGHAIRAAAGLTRINLSAEADAFADHWKSQAGARGVKLDWKATWRNWCRRATGQPWRGGGAQQPGPVERNRIALQANLDAAERSGDAHRFDARRDGDDDV